MIALEVVGVRLLSADDSPVLLLQESNGSRCLPIWIGHAEAAAIATALEAVAPERPMTHDLLAEVVRLHTTHGKVLITAIEDGIYQAQLMVGEQQLIARPSDCVALALRLGWPIECPVELMDQVGVEIEPAPADEVEAFRAFLDHVQPDDFTTE